LPRTSAASVPTALPTLSTEDGLPRRVRQASLAPQLRQSAAEAGEETVAFRSPEQVRSIMNAFQHGTTRGRIDASHAEPIAVPSDRGAEVPASWSRDGNRGERLGNGADSVPEDRSNRAELDIEGRPRGESFTDAATVGIPAIVSPALARDETLPQRATSSGDGSDSAAHRAAAPGGTDVIRPEKDAK
jgi:hypothetical protein